MFGVRCPRCKKVLHRGQPLLDDGLVLLTTTYYHLLYHILPRTTTYYHVLPRTTTYYHILPRTTAYYHVLPRTARTTAERSFCISGSHPCTSALLFYCSTSLLFYYFTMSLHTQCCRGRCLGLAARDAKSLFASRTATLRCRLRTTTYYHILPRTTTYYHVLPRTTTYDHVLQQKKSLHLGQPRLHVGPRILLFYKTILIFCYFTPHTVLLRPMFGVGSPACKIFFASRAAALRCRPRTTYHHVLPLTTTYHITTYYHVLPRTTTCYHVLPRTTAYYHVLPRTIVQAERSFCISGSHPCMSGLLFYCFTVLPFYYLTISLHIQY